MSGFQMIIVFHTFIAAFGRGSVVIDLFPFVTVTGRKIVQAGISRNGNGKSFAEPCRRAGSAADTFALFHERTAEFCALPFGVGAVGFHLQTCGTDGNPVRSDRDGAERLAVRFGVAGIEVDKRRDRMVAAKFINGHRVMGGIERQTGRPKLRKEREKAEKGLAKSRGVVSGSGMKERKEG